MKKQISLVLLLISFISCKQKIETSDIQKINGYWEIEKVVLPNSDDKDYKVNETIDFFKLEKNEGFRKKVTPQLDGKYLVNDFSEKIKIVVVDDKTYIEYSTDFAKWKDEIISISDEKLILKNDANIEYRYKKPIPFSIK
jgi:hypothetical protein